MNSAPPVIVKNKVSDQAGFSAAIIHAEEYTRELRPSSISAAILSERNKLEELDSRLSVSDIEIRNGVVTCFLQPREPVDLLLTPEKDEIREHGLPCEWKGEEGSELILINQNFARP